MLSVVEQVPEEVFLEYRHKVTQAFNSVSGMFDNAGNMQIALQKTG